jgi:DNA-binding LytR/AlgR family response regulator
MHQPLLPPQLMGQALPEQVITILRGSVHLCVSDIIRLEAERNYTRFVLKDGRKLLTSKNISFYEPLLAESFVRVHKSHLLNRRYITKKSKTHICMSDGAEVEVSRRKRRIAKRTIN